jgi:hypothetical protein
MTFAFYSEGLPLLLPNQKDSLKNLDPYKYNSQKVLLQENEA